MTHTNAFRLEKTLFFLWFGMNLIIGALTVHEYGMSIDEPNNYRYAADTIAAYPSFFGTLYEPKYEASYEGHGPAFVTMTSVVIKIVQRIVPNVFAPDLWHFAYFTAFQLAGLCLYRLAKRWFNTWTAWGILILFTTQPLLWGHAFINPKDIPFMAFFIASIATGFAMVDGIAGQASYPEIGVGSNVSINNGKRSFWSPFVSQVVRGFTNPGVLLAGIFLGLTTSIRILGPYAGAIVLLYALSKSHRRTPGVLLADSITAALVCFLTWPYLWSDPITKFLQSIDVAGAYPWQGTILFEGNIIAARDLPARYLPKMISIQFTEVAIALFIAGVVLATLKAFKNKIQVPLVLLFIWFLIPLAAIILNRSVVYDGFRQILFLTPPLFICAGFAFEWIFARIKPVALRLLTLVLISAPGVYSIVALHPYEYVYYNSFVGGVQGAYENYELDYWATSFREAALFVNENASPDAHIVVFGPLEVYEPYSRPDIKLNRVKLARQLEEQEGIIFKYAVILNRRNIALDNCETTDAVKTVERAGARLVTVKEISDVQDDCP